MTLVPASSRGSTFNGGTITQPLVIAPTDPSVIPLSIEASWNAWATDFFRVLNLDTNTRMLAVDVSGNVLAWRHTSEADRNLVSNGSAVDFVMPGIHGSGAAGSRSLGFFDHTVAAQPAAIPDAAGGVVIDAEARAALNALLAGMRSVGLIAT